MPSEEEDTKDDNSILELKLRNRLKIEPEALDEEFQRCAASVATVGAHYAVAIGEHLRSKSRAKRTRGLVWLELRETLQNKHGRATADHIAAAVEQDQRVIDADDDEITCEVARERKKSDLAAMMAKRDMLIQMGSARRSEMASDPSIREFVKGRKLLHGGG